MRTFGTMKDVSYYNIFCLDAGVLLLGETGLASHGIVQWSKNLKVITITFQK